MPILSLAKEMLKCSFFQSASLLPLDIWLLCDGNEMPKIVHRKIPTITPKIMGYFLGYYLDSTVCNTDECH